MKKNFDKNAAYQPANFNFKDENKVKEIIARYPEGRQRSAVMPLLDLAQRQMAEEGRNSTPKFGGWIPAAAIDKIASIIEEPPINVLEVAMFYSMYNLEPVGVNLIQICTTTPCWLRGSDNIVECCKKEIGIGIGQTSKDGLFSLMEVECLGACANAPVVQINDSFYEDLTEETTINIIKALKDGKNPQIGSQIGRQCSCASGACKSKDTEEA